MKKLSKYYTLFPLSILCIYYLVKSYFFVIQDFGNYYFGSLLFKMNTFTTEIYAPNHYNNLVHNLGYDFLGTYLPFTPITTLFYYPFTFFDPFVAKIIFNVISIVLFLVTTYRFSKFLGVNKRYLLLLPILFFMPLRNGILFGQFYLLLYVFIVEAYLLYQKNNKWLSALLLSIAISIKIFPILLVFIFIKDWKQITRLFIFGLVLLSLSLFFNGLSVWQFYVTEIFNPGINGIMGIDYSINYQSVAVLLKYLFVEDSYFNSTPICNSIVTYHYVLILYKTMLLTLGMVVSYFGKDNKVKFGLWMLIVVLLSPNGSTYSLILLLIPLLILLADPETKINRVLLALGLVFLISNIPWNIITTKLIILKFPRLLFLLLFSILLFKWYYNTKLLIKFSIVFLILLGFQLLKSVPLIQKGKTVYGGKSVINSFEVIKGKVIVEEFTDTEKIKQTILNIDQPTISKNLEIKNNQIYLHQNKITNTKDNKENAIMVNNTILYLSDYNQGYKFYNLRSIPIPKNLRSE